MVLTKGMTSINYIGNFAQRLIINSNPYWITKLSPVTREPDKIRTG